MVYGPGGYKFSDYIRVGFPLALVFWFIAITDVMKVNLSHEHEQYAWLEWDAAAEQLTHDGPRQVLRAAQTWLDEHNLS